MTIEIKDSLNNCEHYQHNECDCLTECGSPIKQQEDIDVTQLKEEPKESDFEDYDDYHYAMQNYHKTLASCKRIDKGTFSIKDIEDAFEQGYLSYEDTNEDTDYQNALTKFKIKLHSGKIKEESQEELFRQVIEIFNSQHAVYGRPDYGMLKDKFTITRKNERQ